MRRRWRDLWVLGAAAVGFGAAIAAVAAAAGGTAAAGSSSDRFIAGAHLPPLLTLPGEQVTLRYAIVCSPADPAHDPVGTPCDGGGDVYARAGHSGPYRRFALVRGGDTRDGRDFVELPAAIAASPDGFSYYATLRDNATGETTTLPAAGAAAPQNSYPIADATTVDLGPHRFGATRAPDARVVRAAWGAGAAEAGLSGGPGDPRVGPASFDVAPDGTVTLLDELNRRIVRWRHGVPSALPLDVATAIDDMAVGPDGSIYVADGTRQAGTTPMLRTFAPDGRLVSAQHLPERTWTQLRVGPDGPVVQEHPSEQWMPRAGASDGRAGRPLADGSRLIVLRTGDDEVRVARVVNGREHDSWRVRSDTPLGEVQLADVTGNRLVLVVKAYVETNDEFEVLVLDRGGLVRRFSVPSAAWAETAPLARFRLVGTSLYQLGSDSTGVFVDRYDLGGVS